METIRDEIIMLRDWTAGRPLSVFSPAERPVGKEAFFSSRVYLFLSFLSDDDENKMTTFLFLFPAQRQ